MAYPHRQPTELCMHCMQNLAAWAVAGTAAYILWIKPEQKEQQKRVSDDVMQLSML